MEFRHRLTSHPCRLAASHDQTTPKYDFFNRYTKRQSKKVNGPRINNIKNSNRYKFSLFLIRLLAAPTIFHIPAALRLRTHRFHSSCPGVRLAGIVSVMHISEAEQKNSASWESFVASHPGCVNYHRWAWKRVIEQAFGWRTFYLFAEHIGKISGILPLVWLKSRFFGNLLCSLPFFSEAGLLADTAEAREALLTEAIRLARDVKAEYIELRHRGESPVSWPAKTKKVTLECDVFPDPEENMRHLSTKMRTNVRRSLKLGLEAKFGREEFLGDFYHVFCLKMRELGTPVYSRRFFDAILENFPNESFICRVRHQGQTVAAGFLTGWRGMMEANWSASSPRAMNLRPNMFLFWQMLCFAGQKGYQIFDFGRSSIGSGTYEFKQQWNTRIIPMHWNSWTASGEKGLELNPDNPRYRAAIWTWQRMPLLLTKWLGPPIARCLP